MRKIKRLTISLAYRMVFTIVVAFFVFNAITSTLGYFTFEQALIQECEDAAYRTARSASMLVNGDTVSRYINGDSNALAYAQTQSYLDKLCSSQEVTHVSVIAVNTEDYNTYTTIFYSSNQEDEEDIESAGNEYTAFNEATRRDYQSLYEGKSLESSMVSKTGGASYVSVAIPVKNSGGKIVALITVQRPMLELDQGRSRYMFLIGVSSVLITALAAVSAFYFMRKQFVLPIRKIVDEMKRFSKEGTKENALDLENLSGIAEIYQLASSVGKMETQIVRNTKELTTITAEQERLNTELTLAQSIQANVLPNIFPPFPERKEFDIYAGMHPAKEVAGDFYDFFLLDDDHLGLVMADVSGKGVPAALFMMATKIMLKSYALINQSPKEVIEKVNDDICSGNQDDMFVTIWFGILDLRNGVVKAVNAGHEYPIIKHNKGQYEILKDKHGLVVGGMSGIKYREYEFTLEPGDSLFLYTDGIPEATNQDQELFGMDRLVASLNTCTDDMSQQSVLTTVNRSVSQFVGNADQFDDITMMGLKVYYLRNENEIQLIPTKDSISFLSAFIEEKAEKMELSMKLTHQLLIASDEIYSNIIYYSHATKASCRIEKEAGSLILEFKDNGIPFDPTNAKEADITSSLEEREIGGLGIMMVKKTCQSLTYERSNDENILRIQY